MDTNKDQNQSSFNILYSDVLRYFMKGRELTEEEFEAIEKVKKELEQPFSGSIYDL